jgi:hypothetical protein
MRQVIILPLTDNGRIRIITRQDNFLETFVPKAALPIKENKKQAITFSSFFL